MNTFYKYPMKQPDDYRGEVKLVSRSNGVDVAYTATTTPDDDMVPLSPSELEYVKRNSDTSWLNAEKQYLIDIDMEADEVRKSYMDIGRDTIDTEYQQVKEVLSQWRKEGSDVTAVPEEIMCWAEANSETLDWAIEDIEREMMLHRELIKMVRKVRLEGKAKLKKSSPSEAKKLRDETVGKLRSMKKAGFDH